MSFTPAIEYASPAASTTRLEVDAAAAIATSSGVETRRASATSNSPSTFNETHTPDFSRNAADESRTHSRNPSDGETLVSALGMEPVALSHEVVKKLAGTNEAKKFSKVLRRDGKTSELEMKKAMKELAALEKEHKRAVKTQASAETSHRKADKLAKKLQVVLIKAREKLDEALVKVNKRRELASETKSQAAELSERFQAKMKEVQAMRESKSLASVSLMRFFCSVN
ncbi:hypothetical protein BKA62DRAFT_712186 [Auriculariales sp. MPI-PUGE-AT-0066]|nr:hypothetical protein BKA62DRAFT_712186 [Auriculariales sp. MPI-PUGE-AT-0066]